MNRFKAILSIAIAILILITISFFSLRTAVFKNRDLKVVSSALEKEIEDFKKYKRQSENDFALLQEEFESYRANMRKMIALDIVRTLVSEDELSEIIEEIPSGSFFRTPFHISAGFGESIGFKGAPRENHRGLDAYPINPHEKLWTITPLAPGTVTGYGFSNIYGKYIYVQHSPRVRTFYAHLEKIFYAGTTGTEVDSDTGIGFMGDTGMADGKHIHFEIQVHTGFGWESIDPEPWLER